MAAFVFMSPLDTKHHLVDHSSNTATASSNASSSSTNSTNSVFSNFFSKFATPCSASSGLMNSSNSVSLSKTDLDVSSSAAVVHPVKHLELDSPTSPDSHCMVKKIKSIFSSPVNNTNTNKSTAIISSSSLITTTSTNSTIQSASSSSSTTTTSSSKCSLLKLLSNETCLFNKCESVSSSPSSCFIDAFELKNRFLNLANQVARDFFIIMLDCRSFSDFNSKRIKDSIHVNCRDKLSKKRLMTRKITVRDLISSSLTCESLRNRFDLNNNTASSGNIEATVDENSSSSEDSQSSATANDENNLIILYDDTTSDLTDLQSDSNPLKIVQDNIEHTGPKNGCKILKGGFKQFSEICPEYVEEVLKLNSNQANSKYYEYQADQHQSSIENAKMTCIESFLYLGNESDARNVARLEKEGIYYVLNVTKNIPFYDDLVPPCAKSKFVFKRIGVNDSCDQNLRKHFDEAIEFIDEAIRNESKVLVHCQAGVSRSPTIVIAYLMHKYNMRMNDAYARVRDMRPIVAPNLIFIGQLLDFESKLFPTSITNTTSTTTTTTTSSLPLTSCASSFTFASTASTTSIANNGCLSSNTTTSQVDSSTGFNLTMSADSTTTTNNDDSESQKTVIACN